MTGLRNLLRLDRARHFLAAMVIAMVLGVTGFVAPLDWLIWTTQSRTLERFASGEIVFIASAEDLTDPAKPERRRELAMLIDRLGEAGASKVFLDATLQQPSSPAADEALTRAIERSGRTHLVQRYVTRATGPKMLSTIPAIAGTAPRVVAEEWLDPFGTIWSADLGGNYDGTFYQSFAAALANAPSRADRDFRIDYSIAYGSVPSVSMPEAFSAISAGKGSALFGGKFVVIGNGGGADAAYRAIPGHPRVPASMVAILAGETLRAGPYSEIGWGITFLVFALPFMAVVFLAPNSRRRHWGYALVSMSVPAWFLVSPHLRVTPHLSVPIALLAIYGAIRLWKARHRNASLVDELSGLPNFRALEKDLARRPAIARTSVVVARIHRFDEVLAILPAESQGDYVRLVADRFRIAEERLTIYCNAGRYLAWVQEVEDEPHLEAHLKGLRAIFAHPLYVDETPIDVGITFGADATSEPSPARKIASATATVDKTTEAHAPVLLADSSSVSDRMWNVSLQAKIDAALRSGQIYVVYQPQFHLPTGRLCGFESLVRWNDPERGSIAPSYFIEQCEHAGRMEALTRKVFEESIEAIGRSPFADGPCRISMNVSATLLGDDRVAELIEGALAGSKLERNRVTLEITETARIADYDKARTALGKLQELGVRISIDDFGVGAASLETLLRLPFDELKIDRAFVARIRDDAKARHIVQALINLCRDVGLDVVAEGVEDHDTLDILRSLGCEAVQGYALGRPDHLVEMERYLRPDLAQRMTGTRS